MVNKEKHYKILTLLGNPKSTSHIYKVTCRGKFGTMYMSKEGKEIKESYIEQAKKQYKDKILTEDLKTIVVLYFGDKRKRDHDNYGKLIFDSLEGIVYEDDKQIKDGRTILAYDKENPRAEIIIELLDQKDPYLSLIDKMLEDSLAKS